MICKKKRNSRQSLLPLERPIAVSYCDDWEWTDSCRSDGYIAGNVTELLFCPFCHRMVTRRLVEPLFLSRFYNFFSFYRHFFWFSACKKKSPSLSGRAVYVAFLSYIVLRTFTTMTVDRIGTCLSFCCFSVYRR